MCVCVPVSVCVQREGPLVSKLYILPSILTILILDNCFCNGYTKGDHFALLLVIAD